MAVNGGTPSQQARRAMPFGADAHMQPVLSSKRSSTAAGLALPSQDSLQRHPSGIGSVGGVGTSLGSGPAQVVDGVYMPVPGGGPDGDTEQAPSTDQIQRLDARVHSLTMRMRDLYRPIGQGEYAAPVHTVLERANVTMERRISALEGTAYTQYELPPTCDYVRSMQDYKKQYDARCKTMKGTGVSVGHSNNWVCLGLIQGIIQDQATLEDTALKLKDYLSRVIGCDDNADSIDPNKIPNLWQVVRHCQLKVTGGNKRAFLMIAFSPGEAMQHLAPVVENAVMKYGNPVKEPPPLTPVTRALKDDLVSRQEFGPRS